MFFNRIAQETSSVHDSAYVRDGNGEKESLIKLARQAMGEMDQDEQAKLERQQADDKAEVSRNPAYPNARSLYSHVRAFIQFTYVSSLECVSVHSSLLTRNLIVPR